METLTMKKMKENYVYVMGMCGIYGLIFTFCLYENLIGITFPICVAATIIVSAIFLRKMEIAIKRYFLLYVIGMMLLGISTVLTMNGFFHLFNWAGILLLLMTAMIQQLSDNGSWSFQKYTMSIAVMIGKIITSVFNPISDGVKYSKTREKKTEKNRYWKSILIGIVCAVGLLVVVLPLLVFSDKIFARFFGNFIEIFRFGEEIGIVFTFLAGFILMYAFLSAISRFAVNYNQENKNPRINALTGITFTGIMAAIYIFYSAIQILFLFLRLDSGLPEGVTYSQYANSGFWQLLAVSLINFVMVLICISIFKENKILKILLLIISICTCIMDLSAAYRMMLYVEVYHLSFLRVLVLWFLGVLMIIMLGVILSVLKREFRLFQYIMVVVAVCYIGLSFSKVDKIVAEYNLAHWDSVSHGDMMNLMYRSSLDSAPYIAGAAGRAEKSYSYSVDKEVHEYFQQISNRDMSVRSWNLSLAQAKRAAEQYLSE